MIGKLFVRVSSEHAFKDLAHHQPDFANPPRKSFLANCTLHFGKLGSAVRSLQHAAENTRSAMTYSHNDQWFDQHHQRPTT